LAHIEKRTIGPGLLELSLRRAPPFDAPSSCVIQITRER
jgi:hypothetical protein